MAYINLGRRVYVWKNKGHIYLGTVKTVIIYKKILGTIYRDSPMPMASKCSVRVHPSPLKMLSGRNHRNLAIVVDHRSLTQHTKLATDF